MSIQLSDNITVGQQIPLESKYFNGAVPYTSVLQANTNLVSGVRYRGLTVNINGVEYWYKDGILDTDLVIKISDPLPPQTGNSGKFLTTNGTNTSWEYVLNGTGFVKANGTTITYDNSTYLTSAILSLNGLTNSSQTFVTGSSGNDFNISSASGTHTFNIPDASTTARGLITTGTQTISGSKTFSNAPTFSSIVSGGATQFRLLSTNSTGLVNNTPFLIWDSGISGLGINKVPASALDISGSVRIANQLWVAGLSTPSNTNYRMVVSSGSFGVLSLQDIPTPADSYFAQYLSYTAQTAVTNNIGIPMFFETVDLNNGITVVSDGTPTSPNNLTKILFSTTGKYNLQFSVQLQNLSNLPQDVNIWLRKNGTDVVGSTGVVGMEARKNPGDPYHTIASWNYLLDVASNDYYQLIWATDDVTNVSIEFYASTANHPSTASTLFTVTQVQGVLGGNQGLMTLNAISTLSYPNITITPDNSGTYVGGTDVNVNYGNIAGVPGNIFLRIPTAGMVGTTPSNTIVRGLVSNAAQTFYGTKTFNSAPILTTTTATTLLISNASKAITSFTSVQNGMIKITSNQPVVVTGNSNTITYWQNSETIGSLDTSTYPNLTELSYVKGVTSAIQTQLNNKQPLSTNLTSLSGLTYASASFVKMTAAGTFTLDTASYQSPLTFSTGLTNTGGTITNNLSTGIAGSQTLVGSTSASQNLILSSTSNATKGRIYFGTANTSVYDELNDRIGVGTGNPLFKLDVVGTARVTLSLTVDGPILTSGGSAGSAGQVLTSGGAGTNFSWTNVQQPITLTTTGTTGAATFISNALNIPQYQGQLTLTTTGTTGVATLVGNTLNIPQYSAGGGGGGAGISLPVPKIILMPSYPPAVQVLNAATGGSAGYVFIHKAPIVIAEDISSEVLANYQVFVEMVHYKRKNTKYTAGRKKRSGYVVESDLYFNPTRTWRAAWPANFWNRNDSRHVTPQHQGSIFSPGVEVSINRPNWYEVTAQNQSIPVWEYLNSRYYERTVEYRDTTNTVVSLDTIIPVYGSKSPSKDSPTSRFAYSPLYTPLYVAFRYIVWNPNGGGTNPNTELPYGEILSGPLSRVVKISHQQFPFNYDYTASSYYGVPCANISALYDKWHLQCFFETRLP